MNVLSSQLMTSVKKNGNRNRKLSRRKYIKVEKLTDAKYLLIILNMDYLKIVLNKISKILV